MKKLTSILLLSLILLTISCNRNKKEQQTAAIDNIKVRVEQVAAQDVEQLYVYTAIVQAEAVNNIAPTLAGRIDQIFVEVGDFVKKGQKLVQMDASNLTQAKSQLDNLQLTFDRIDGLYKVGGVSKAEWDAQKTALDVAKTSYNNLLENTQLLSPLDGVITMRNYDSGDIYAGNPVLQVQQIKPVKMNINVSEKQYTQVKKGQTAKVKIDVFEDEEFTGKINLVYPTIDSRTHTFPVEVVLQNANQKVRPGMYARVTMNYGVAKHVVVPDKAIVKQQGSGDRYIYVYHEDGTVSYNKVEIGRRMDDKYELISGVEDGDFVVITGQSKLNNGMKVEVVE